MLGLGLWDNGGHGKVFFDGSMELRWRMVASP
jgi:hypothetical protein